MRDWGERVSFADVPLDSVVPGQKMRVVRYICVIGKRWGEAEKRLRAVQLGEDFVEEWNSG